MAEPFYDRDGITIYVADALDDWRWLAGEVLVTDPPFGINYNSGHFGHLPRSIAGDRDTTARDTALRMWGNRPALVFGSWRIPRPVGTRALLVWDTGGALGMGALDLPWKPAHQEIYVLGKGFEGKRTSDVLRYSPVQAKATNGRVHPHQKPVALMKDLLSKCPPGVIVDPFMGSGTTLVAAQEIGRRAIGVEISEEYASVAVGRLAQAALLISLET